MQKYPCPRYTRDDLHPEHISANSVMASVNSAVKRDHLPPHQSSSKGNNRIAFVEYCELPTAPDSYRDCQLILYPVPLFLIDLPFFDGFLLQLTEAIADPYPVEARIRTILVSKIEAGNA